MADSTDRRFAARFLLAYRAEVADAPLGEQNAARRGWIARVPTSGEQSRAQQPEMRWFTSLEELPDLIREMAELRGGPS